MRQWKQQPLLPFVQTSPGIDAHAQSGCPLSKHWQVLPWHTAAHVSLELGWQ